jgi:hypothetical protein
MKSEKQNKGNNQTVILLAGAVILLLIVFAFLWMLKNQKDSNSLPGSKNNTNQVVSGYVTQKGNLVKGSDNSWTLLYDKPGTPAAVVNLIIRDDTFCRKDTQTILCSQLQNGHIVSVYGNLENNILTAKEINLLDEIRVEAKPADSTNPQSSNTQTEPTVK